MATPTQALSEERYERLCDLYLTLWKQLDLVCGDTKWLEIRPPNQTELQIEAEVALAGLTPYLGASDVLADVVNKDFRRTQKFLQGVAEINGMNCTGFKDYLRDHALRYAEASDEL